MEVTSSEPLVCVCLTEDSDVTARPSPVGPARDHSWESSSRSGSGAGTSFPSQTRAGSEGEHEAGADVECNRL